MNSVLLLSVPGVYRSLLWAFLWLFFLVLGSSLPKALMTFFSFISYLYIGHPLLDLSIPDLVRCPVFSGVQYLDIYQSIVLLSRRLLVSILLFVLYFYLFYCWWVRPFILEWNFSSVFFFVLFCCKILLTVLCFFIFMLPWILQFIFLWGEAV